MNLSEIRAEARRSLGGKIFDNTWLYALVAALIASAIISVGSYVVVGTFILMGPVTYGVSRYFLSLYRGANGKENFNECFSGFTVDFAGNMILGIMMSIFTLLWSLLFVIPGIIMGFAYSMAFFIKADNPEYDWRMCLNESKRIMKGNKWNLFCLELSFIGWGILCIFTFGIGILWLQPYMYAATAVFYEKIK